MFCEKCGREINHDSVYCSYCGKKVEEPQQEDRRDEDREFHPSEPAACIKPHMPKKHCPDCGKELPGSNISDVCALCTIRRRNREEMQRRKDAKTDAKRDRYDISDEFDQSVFSQGRYYREPVQSEQVRSGKSNKWYSDREEEKKDAKKQRSKKIGLIAIAVFIVYFVVSSLIGYLVIDKDVDIPEVTIEPQSEVSVPEVNLPDYGIDYYGDESLQESSDEFVVESYADFEELVQLISEQTLQVTLESETVIPASVSLTSDGAYVYTTGVVVYNDEGTYKTSQYKLCIMLTKDMHVPLQAIIDGETLFDYRTYVTRYGDVTEDGTVFYEMEAGLPLFGDEPLLLLEDFEEESTSTTDLQNV